jgi:hypothetical protein
MTKIPPSNRKTDVSNIVASAFKKALAASPFDAATSAYARGDSFWSALRNAGIEMLPSEGRAAYQRLCRARGVRP